MVGESYRSCLPEDEETRLTKRLAITTGLASTSRGQPEDCSQGATHSLAQATAAKKTATSPVLHQVGLSTRINLSRERKVAVLLPNVSSGRNRRPEPVAAAAEHEVSTFSSAATWVSKVDHVSGTAR